MFCKGIITDLVGQPIPKAIITIKSIRGATSITSSVYFHQCNDKGEYNFSLLKGKYKIWVQNSNFSDKNLVGVGIVESDTPDGDIDSILVAEVEPTPDEPITPSGCECTWIKKTLIPTYFYITLDDTAKDLTDSEIEEVIKNTDVTVLSYEGYSYETVGIPKQYPLIYLGKTEEGYKYAFPYSMSNTEDSYNYPTGHEKSILIQLHNRLSQYNTEGSSSVHGLTKTNGTLIYRESYGVGGKWPATNKIILSLASEDYNIRPDLDWDVPSERPPVQDTAKVYYYKHIDNKIEAVPMTFEFLETVRQCTTEEDDKPEETPKPPTPETPTPETPTPETPDYTTPVGVVEGVLTPYTLKVRFTAASWYRDPGRFSVYHSQTQTWKEATKIVDDVVYFIFTEEEALNCNNDGWNHWRFAKHPPMPIQEINWENNTHETFARFLKFYDTIMDDVVNIEDNEYLTAYVTIGSAYI